MQLESELTIRENDLYLPNNAPVEKIAVSALSDTFKATGNYLQNWNSFRTQKRSHSVRLWKEEVDKFYEPYTGYRNVFKTFYNTSSDEFSSQHLVDENKFTFPPLKRPIYYTFLGKEVHLSDSDLKKEHCKKDGMEEDLYRIN